MESEHQPNEGKMYPHYDTLQESQNPIGSVISNCLFPCGMFLPPVGHVLPPKLIYLIDMERDP